MKSETKSIIGLLLIVIFFVFFSYLVQTNLKFVESLIVNDFLGIFVYVFLAIMSVVIAPVASVFLMPVASNLWGVFLTGILSIVGWSIGSYIAFVLARKYGIDLIKRFVSLEQIYEFEKRIPSQNIFWIVVLIRMITPPDFTSYAIGLFSKIKTAPYMIATIIGLAPFSFVLAYLGVVPFIYQIIGFLLIGIFVLIGIIFYKRKRN
ncbi:MAG: VTT domain-containing protein [Nanoarchaeota archaeon]|nr:VTT domain-containing protein [Nanoarchaeota archaeon]